MRTLMTAAALARSAEIAMAESAAPKDFRDFVFDATLRAPICFDAVASRTVLPYYDNASLGGNEFGHGLPQLSDDAGTPFAVVVIPVDHALFIHSAGVR
jgi:hypothetical protein